MRNEIADYTKYGDRRAYPTLHGPSRKEIARNMPISKSLFKDVTAWKKLINQPELAAYVVYGADDSFPQKENHLYSWKSINAMLKKIYV